MANGEKLWPSVSDGLSDEAVTTACIAGAVPGSENATGCPPSPQGRPHARDPPGDRLGCDPWVLLKSCDRWMSCPPHQRASASSCRAGRGCLGLELGA